MKFVITFFLFVAAAQAVDWTNVRARFRVMPTTGYKPPSTGHIIGGSEAERHQFPYQVAMFLDGTYFCGGSVISDTIVLTAGHCVDGTSEFEVHFGAQNVYSPGEANHQVIYSRDGTLHALYNSALITNDIGFVRMMEPVVGEGIASIRLPSRSMASLSFAGEIARVSGWGRTSDDDPYISETLRWVDVSIISNVECYRVYGSTIRDTNICISNNGGAAGTCGGDSGGPLTIVEEDGLPTEIGIVSFGAADGCELGYPSGFTRVTSYLDWIEENSGVPIRD